jgi:hypothetical protein
MNELDLFQRDPIEQRANGCMAISELPINPRRLRSAVGLILALVAFIAVMATTDDYGFAIDEATYFWVADEARQWFVDLPHNGWNAFSLDMISRRFHFLEPPGVNGPGQHSNLNLPVTHHLMNVSYAIGHWGLDKRTAYRLANALLFAICVWCTFDVLAGYRSWIAGTSGALALVLSPRVFGHAHLAATETTMAALWMLSLLVVFRLALISNRASALGIVGCSFVLALTLGTKLTAWLMIPPTFAWLVFFRPMGWLRVIVTTIVLAPLLLYVMTPPLWHAPVQTFAEHLRTVAGNPWKIMTFYGGACHLGMLPWSSGPVTFLVTLPITWLILSVLGALAFRRDSLAALLVANFLVLMGARILGLIPTHDGERQFIPCYYFAAGLVGIGCDELCRWLTVKVRFERRNWTQQQVLRAVGTVCLLGLFTEPALESWHFRRHGLMYYNQLVGGLPGASELGFEVSYWFEAVPDATWREFLRDLPTGSKLFLRPDHPGLEVLKQRGVWRHDLQSTGPEEADYYLLYAKRAAYCITDDGGVPIVTGLLATQMEAPAVKELRFDDVRILALVPTGRDRRAPQTSSP